MPTVLIYWYPGRSSDQKQRVAQRITDALPKDGGTVRESVLILFQEMPPNARPRWQPASAAGAFVTRTDQRNLALASS
jgi:phenylpyruvate tautomerase PptA (4-oxalocrotonate tautomerase family)